MAQYKILGSFTDLIKDVILGLCYSVAYILFNMYNAHMRIYAPDYKQS